MGTIWQPPPGGYVDGPGLLCVGSLDTDPAHPWGRTNAWAYDGAIYGYRQFADSPYDAVQYSVLGGQMSVCLGDPGEMAANKAAQVALLNAGCDVDPFRAAHELALDFTDDASAFGWAFGLIVTCTTDGGDTAAVIKASMGTWGVVRDVMSMNDLGQADLPLAISYVVTGGLAKTGVQLASTDASNLWMTLTAEVQALWNEH